MKTNVVCITLLIIFVALFVGSVLPYPNFYSSTFFLAKDQQLINDKFENENHLNDSIYDTISILNYDWFEFMNERFTKYKTVRVIDILSETEYFVQRLGGYNHADVQTIDYNNTKIFKNVYGGEWSWLRRPVLVEIDGQFFAGSTNGMPHGFSLIDNGEGGHTCIHFLNSKTHGTKRVDEAHQECVKRASNSKDFLVQYLKNRNKNIKK